jgi:WD40 repeat protein
MPTKGNPLGTPLMLSAGSDNIVKLWNMKRFKSVSEFNIGSNKGQLTKAVWVSL